MLHIKVYIEVLRAKAAQSSGSETPNDLFSGRRGQTAASREGNTIRKNKRVARKNAQMGIEEPSPVAAAKPQETPAADTAGATAKPKKTKK